jgi:murein DD-endopeptidase MepM/ murein hydrolase activator NlpD
MTLIPNFDITTLTNPANSARATSPNEVALRQAAKQFEALLLTQLTASLNPKDEGEDALFSNSGGGMGLARQMYSEQLAKTISESGGIGIADMIVAQVTKRNAQPVKNPVTERALSVAREIKNEAAGSSLEKTSPAPGKGTSLDSDSITSEISMTAGKARATVATFSTVSTPDSVSSLPIPIDSSAEIGATRPRRVHAIERNTTVLNEAPAHVARRLNAAVSVKSSRPGVAYVSYHSPLQGTVRSQFGMRRDPINGRMRLHQGIDIPAKRGTPIEAAAAGTVVFAGRNKGYGNMVMIEHADGRRTLYAHAQKLFVEAGDTVAAGQPIAAVGSTGHSTGPHLHFEVRERHNNPVNPLRAMSNDLAFARR